ncbi:MAG: hypothetical protein F6K22_20365 [Okeania sp. SIO2F4]|uniref:hypothetical protein n=1 Tax=Okeania sp. SIO2F4 TaxID=2607790 RepID=UPI00142A8BA9|nr:hypothetical protein [Okeania sp. SIO2F4]NES04974.1 hypothetical protein [Okeania sp. SIO2F4]
MVQNFVVLHCNGIKKGSRLEVGTLHGTSLQSRGKELMIFAYGIDLIFDYHAYVYFLISSHTPHTDHASHTLSTITRAPPPKIYYGMAGLRNLI